MAWAGMNFVDFSKIAKKGRIDTEQTHQQVSTLENKCLYIENIYCYGRTSDREVQKDCEKIAKLLNP